MGEGDDRGRGEKANGGQSRCWRETHPPSGAHRPDPPKRADPAFARAQGLLRASHVPRAPHRVGVMRGGVAARSSSQVRQLDVGHVKYRTQAVGGAQAPGS